MIVFGCDRLLGQADELAGRTYGLLAHGASVTGSGVPLHLALERSAAGPPTALLSPEHGFWGVEQDMVSSRDQRDPWTGIPILSLYGDDKGSLRPKAEVFRGLDLLLIDLQDVGSRYYTYAATAVWAAEVALQAGLEVWLLDRPNPLGGVRIEGPPVQKGFTSFVGALQLPVRHGLTLGELLRLEAARRSWGEGLRIWTLQGWRRSMTWPDLRRPWVAPSPNMPTVEIAHLYPGLCLIEATELSEGRGTTRPFQLVGAPGIDGKALAATLEDLHLPGLIPLPTFFRPQFQKHAGQVCGGVELLLSDAGGRKRPSAAALPAFRLGVELLRAIAKQGPDLLSWRQEPYEFERERPALDLLSGSSTLRLALESGDGLDDWIATWPAYETAFYQERQSVLLYTEEAGP